MSWLKIPSGKYDLVSADSKVSACQLEVTTRYISNLPPNAKILKISRFFLYSYEDLLICDTVDHRQKYAPLRILSFDLECNVPTAADQFANACDDPIFQIASMVSYHGTYSQPPGNSSVQSSGYRSISSIHPSCLYCGILCPNIRHRGQVLRNRS